MQDPMAIGLIIVYLFVVLVLSAIINLLIMLISGLTWGWWMAITPVVLIAANWFYVNTIDLFQP